jgi:nitrite reductase/ring-hydroxylating ferredoxin subunit
MVWTSLCSLDELEEGKGKYVEIDGFQLAVFLNGGAVSVIDNNCPHAGGNLAAGNVEDGCAVCPWHYWSFRLDTGEMRDSPGVAVTKYDVRLYEHQGQTLVQVELPKY